MADLLLVRHATTAWSGHRYCGRSDPDLSRIGRSEAAELARRLARSLQAGQRIVASPRRRAIATAEAIAAAVTDATIEIDERWAETDFGMAEGLTFDDLVSLAPEIATRLVAGDASIDWPSGETSVALVARVEAAWLDARRDGRGTVVVTHGGPMRIAIALATGRPPSEVAIPPPGGVWPP